MQFSKVTGITLMILGGLGFLFFSVLMLIFAIHLKYYPDTTILPKELREIVQRLLAQNPTENLDKLSLSSVFGIQLGSGMPFTTTLDEARDFYFAFSISVTVVSLAILLTAITAIFSPLSLTFTAIFSFLLVAVGLVGAVFVKGNDGNFSETSMDSLPGIATLLSPLFAVIVGSIFQTIYFSMRKKYYRYY